MTNTGRVGSFCVWFHYEVEGPTLQHAEDGRTIPQAMHLRSELRSIFTDCEICVQRLCSSLREASQLCLKEEAGVFTIVSNTDALRTICDKAFDTYSEELMQLWTRLFEPQEYLNGKSIMTWMVEEPWYRYCIPEGLENCLPSVSSVSTYIKRISWPLKFERYLDGTSTLPPINLPLLHPDTEMSGTHNEEGSASTQPTETAAKQDKGKPPTATTAAPEAADGQD